jgi:DNA-binding response OmpR family regulator
VQTLALNVPTSINLYRKSVLICEDDHELADTLALVLEASGYEVFGVARSVEEALGRTYGTLPDLALIDLQLVGELDGFSIAAELAPMGVRIVFLTGDFHRVSVEGRGFEAEILIKPISMDTMIRAIHCALRGSDTVD